MKGDMRVPVASVYRTGGVGGLVGCVGVAASAPTVHHHHIDHDEEQISRLAHHLSQISSDHEGLQVSIPGSPPSPHTTLSSHNVVMLMRWGTCSSHLLCQ